MIMMLVMTHRRSSLRLRAKPRNLPYIYIYIYLFIYLFIIYIYIYILLYYIYIQNHTYCISMSMSIYIDIPNIHRSWRSPWCLPLARLRHAVNAPTTAPQQLGPACNGTSLSSIIGFRIGWQIPMTNYHHHHHHHHHHHWHRIISHHWWQISIVT